MPTLQANCPRCGTKEITFDILSGLPTHTEYDWKHHYEVFSKCRRCHRGVILKISLISHELSKSFSTIGKVLEYTMGLDVVFRFDDYMSLKDMVPVIPPEHLPKDVERAFREGAICLSVGCYNASGAMFRLAIDLATKGLLPSTDGTTGGPNKDQRNKLAFRLNWLFTNQIIPKDLESLANCVRDDGNDGAHDGTLTKEDAADLLDFATVLFERLFTEPQRLKVAEERRVQRRAKLT